MVFKTIISLILGYIGFTQFYPWVKLTVLPSFTQLYPTGFTHWVKRTCKPWVATILTILLNARDARDFSDAAGEREMAPKCGSLPRDAGDLVGLSMTHQVIFG